MDIGQQNKQAYTHGSSAVFINLAERIGFYFVSAAFIVAVLAAIEIYRDKKAQGD